MFNVIASDPSNVLFKAYRIFCVLLFICSMVCLMIGPGIKYLFLLIFCVFIPVLMNGVYSNVSWLLIEVDKYGPNVKYWYLHVSGIFIIGHCICLLYNCLSFEKCNPVEDRQFIFLSIWSVSYWFVRAMAILLHIRGDVVHWIYNIIYYLQQQGTSHNFPCYHCLLILPDGTQNILWRWQV